MVEDVAELVLHVEQVADIVNYVRTSWGNGAVPDATPSLVGRLRAGPN